MPHAKEIFPYALLSTRAIGSAAMTWTLYVCVRRPQVRLPSKISKYIAIKTFNSFWRSRNHNRSALTSSLTTVTPKAVTAQTGPTLQLQNSRRKTRNRPVLTASKLG
jgi:hypothetical protein